MVFSDRRELARRAFRAQRLIGIRLGHDLYSAPALDMLLELYLRDTAKPISLTGLSGAATVPSRTALRVLDRLVRQRLVVRSRDEDDGRRFHVALAPEASALLDRLFDELVALFAPP